MKALLLSTLILTGCSTVQIKPEVIPRQLPVDAMVPCSKATPLTDLSFGSYIEKAGELAVLLKECSLKQQELSDFLRSSE